MEKRFLKLAVAGLLAVSVYLGLFREARQDREGAAESVPIRESQQALSSPSGGVIDDDIDDDGEWLGGEPWHNREGEKREGHWLEQDETQTLIDQALHSPESEDRAFAVSELGLLDHSSMVLLACLEALQDGNQEVRSEAVLALETIGDPTVISTLEHVERKDPSQEVREWASEALEYLREDQLKPVSISSQVS